MKTIYATPTQLQAEKDSSARTVASVSCDRMCNECSRTCTRDWGHNGPHRCDIHARGG
ncbi:MAG: hypothetical protein KDD73_09345 [Anaerolineales bacterium]|nr:hypothetical protein [Anaerolineales bacterium]MCB9127496.1 hypothetical protein [Ardenticatenales bacterium]